MGRDARLLSPRLVACSLLVVALAGCSASNGPGGQSAEGAGHLAYNGASTGEHQTKVDCDGGATLRWSGNLASGQVDVRVLDGDGVQKFSILYSKMGQSSDTKPVSGAAGDWTLTAERKGSVQYGMESWSGQYDLHLDC